MNKLQLIERQVENQQKIVDELRNKRDKLRDERDQRIFKKIEGKCFTYTNKYSSSAPEESWLTYFKILKVKNANFHYLQMEKDCYGTITIKREYTSTSLLFQTMITNEEFDKQFKKLMKEMTK